MIGSLRTSLPSRAWSGFLDRPTVWLVAAALIAQAVALLAMERFPPVLVLFVTLIAVSLPLLFSSLNRTLAAFVFVLMIVQSGARRFEFNPLAYHMIIPILFGAIALMHVLVRRLDEADFTWPAPGFGLAWIGLSVSFVLSAMVGLLREVPADTWVIEIVAGCLYLAFFFALDGLRRPEHFRLIFFALLAGMAVVTIEYMFASWTGIRGFGATGRIVTRQGNLVVLVGPFLTALYLVRHRGGWLWLTGLLPLSLIILLTQQRSLMLAFPIALLFPAIAGLRTKAVRLRRVVALTLLIVLAGLTVWRAVGSMTLGRGATVSEAVSERTEEAADPGSTASLLIRLLSYAQVWREKIVERPVLGWGLGDTTSLRIARTASYRATLVDSSYLTIVWKSGVIGLILFLVLYAIGFRKAYLLTRHPHPEARAIGLGILGAMTGAMILAMASTLISHYRFNVIMAIFLASTVAADRAYGTVDPRRDSAP